ASPVFAGAAALVAGALVSPFLFCAFAVEPPNTSATAASIARTNIRVRFIGDSFGKPKKIVSDDTGGAPRGHKRNVKTGYFLFASRRSISSITRVMALIVRSSGSSDVMSTPASFNRSIGYFDPPALRNVRYLASAA